MKAVRIHEDGGPEVLRYEDVREPAPGPGEVLVRLAAASLNHLDIWIRQGLPSVPKPRILGADGAGTVEALGEGVEGFGQATVVLNPGSTTARTSSGSTWTAPMQSSSPFRPSTSSRSRRAPRLRGGGRVPARLRDGVPHARDPGGPE